MGKIDVRDWEEYDGYEESSYSYLKKKGKHKVAKTDNKDKRLLEGVKPAKRS